MSWEQKLARTYLQKNNPLLGKIPEEIISEFQNVSKISRIFHLLAVLWFIYSILMPVSFALEIITMSLLGLLLIVTIEPLLLRKKGKNVMIGPSLVLLVYLLILNILDVTKLSNSSSLAKLLGFQGVLFKEWVFLSTWMVLFISLMLRMIEWDSLTTHGRLFLITVVRSVGVSLMMVYLLLVLNVFSFPLIPSWSVDELYLLGGILWIGSHLLGALLIEEQELFQKEDFMEALSHSYSLMSFSSRVLSFGILSFFLQVLSLVPRTETWNNIIILSTFGGIFLLLSFQSLSSTKKKSTTLTNDQEKEILSSIKKKIPSLDEIKEKGVLLPRKPLNISKDGKDVLELDPKTVILPKELDDGGAVLTVIGQASQLTREKIKSKTRTIQVFKEQETDEIMEDEETVEIAIDELDVENEEGEIVQLELSSEEWESLKVELIKKMPDELNYEELGLDELGIRSAADFEEFLQGFINKLRRKLSDELEKLVLDVLSFRESRCGVFSDDDFELIRFPGVTILEKRKFEYISTIGFTLIETSSGTFISLPLLKILETKKGSIFKSPFFSIIELGDRGNLVNIFGFTINELKLKPNERLDDMVREIATSFKITEEDFKSRPKPKRTTRSRTQTTRSTSTKGIKKHVKMTMDELEALEGIKNIAKSIQDDVGKAMKNKTEKENDGQGMDDK